MKRITAFTLLLATALAAASCGSETVDSVTPPRMKLIP